MTQPIQTKKAQRSFRFGMNCKVSRWISIGDSMEGERRRARSERGWARSDR